MSKKKKMKKKNKTIDEKAFNTSKIDLCGSDDLNEILRRLKKDYIKLMFKEFQRRKIHLDQISVILFRSDKGDFDPRYIYAVFVRHFVNPKNEYQQVAMSLQAKPTVAYFLAEGSSDVPLKIKFLTESMNNSILLTFTEFKESIDVELLLYKGFVDPAFDYYRDVRFFSEYDPYDYGYILYIIRTDIGKFKIIKNISEIS